MAFPDMPIPESPATSGPGDDGLFPSPVVDDDRLRGAAVEDEMLRLERAARQLANRQRAGGPPVEAECRYCHERIEPCPAAPNVWKITGPDGGITCKDAAFGIRRHLPIRTGMQHLAVQAEPSGSTYAAAEPR